VRCLQKAHASVHRRSTANSRLLLWWSSAILHVPDTVTKTPTTSEYLFLSLAYAAMTQPLHHGIRCCVEGSETTFELVYRATVSDVRHGLGGSTDAQWVVGITPLMETG